MMKHFVEAVFFVSFAAALVHAAVNEDYQLEGRPSVKDFSDAGGFHFGDTTEVAEEEYEGQQSDDERERRCAKR